MVDESSELLQYMLGVSTPAAEPQVSSSNEGTQETYQLPVQVGVQEEPAVGKQPNLVNLQEGGRPWIVGYFSPNAPTDKNHTHHDGVDLKANRGTPIYPIASGVIVRVVPDQTAESMKSGNMVVVSHEDGKVTSSYMHLDAVHVASGQKVEKRTVLGLMGDTGNAKGRGAHLHFEVKVGGSKINPLSIVGKLVGSLSSKAALFTQIEKLAHKFEIFTST